MNRDDWLRQALADAPPLDDAQLAALRPVCLRMAGRINGDAAPAVEREPRTEITETEPERNSA